MCSVTTFAAFPTSTILMQNSLGSPHPPSRWRIRWVPHIYHLDGELTGFLTSTILMENWLTGFPPSTISMKNSLGSSHLPSWWRTHCQDEWLSLTARQFTGSVNHSKSLSREPCGREGKCEERGIQSCRTEGGKEVGRDRERNGRNGGRVERDEGREKKRGRKGRLKRVCYCHYNHSLTSHEGLHGVIISCYGNIISILQVADQCRDFVGVNSLQSASSIHPIFRHHNHAHVNTHLCMSARVHK